MCGIAALLSTGSELSSDWMAAMCRQVRHRGPDGDGMVVFQGGTLAPRRDSVSAPASIKGSVLLGHTRLAIVDLSDAGAQPMSREDAWIVYNGEVYNHLELRLELEREGVRFATRSDTEVLLAAYRRWGAGFLHRLNGMFAFVLVDARARKVLVARDRFGVKPLYFWSSPSGMLAFCSEVKQLTVLPGWRAVLNEARARDFLVQGLYDHTDETLFRGVRQLRGGEALEIELDAQGHAFPEEPTPWRWYAPEIAPFRGSFDEAVAAVRELLTDSVRLRLRADVEVGSCLSGGLDSSAIVCLTSRLLAEKGTHAGQATFSACWDVERFDERRYAEQVVAASGARAQYVYPSLEEMFAVLDDLVWYQDEPFGSTSIFAQWCVFRAAARSGVKVMLDGQGADETLGGYHGFLGARFAGLLRSVKLVHLLGEFAAAKRLHGYGLGWSAGQAAVAAFPAAARMLRSLAPPPAWLNTEALPSSSVPDPVPRHSVAALSRAQVSYASLPALLHWEDRGSMANSVESRVPFLDYRLVELSLSLPDAFKVESGVTKRVLREAMRGVLPEAVRERRDKLGFQTPEREWLMRAPEQFRKAMRSALECSQGILTGEAMTLLEDTISGRRPFSFLFWRMLFFGRWMGCFSVHA